MKGALGHQLQVRSQSMKNSDRQGVHSNSYSYCPFPMNICVWVLTKY